VTAPDTAAPAGGNWRDSMVAAVLALTPGFALFAPQGLTWLPAVVSLMMALAWRHRDPKSRLLDAAGDNAALLALMGLLAGWMIYASAASLDPESGLIATMWFWFSILSAMLAIWLPSIMGHNGPWAWGYFAVLHLVLALCVWLLAHGAFDLSFFGGERLLQSWHYNRAAVLVALLWPVTLFSLRRLLPKGPGLFIAAGCLFAVIAGAVLSSYSESAMLALVAIVAVQLLSILSLRVALTALAACTVAALVVLPPVFDGLYELVIATPLATHQPGTFGARLQIWRGMVDYIWQSPWFGNGLEHVRLAGHRDPVTGAITFHNHAHSFLFQSWVDLGLVGVALLAATLVVIARRIIDVGGEGGVMFGAMMAGILAVWSVSHGMWQPWYVGMAGLALALASFAHQRHRAEQWLADERARRTLEAVLEKH